MSIIAHLTAGESAVIASGLLWQWDRGQTLEFSGVELPPAFKADFCNAGDAETIPMTGTDGAVVIPDEFLLDGRPVICFVVVPDLENERETKYKIIMPVIPRPQPSDIEPTPEQEAEIDQLIAALDAGVDAAEAAQEGAETAQGKAEDAQEASEAARDAAIEAQTAANSSAQNAAASASRASEQASIAQVFANHARVSETRAEQSAVLSGGHAQDAQDAADAAEAAANTILGMSATAETLPAGSQATASYNDGLLTIGVPTGTKGDPGVGVPAGGSVGDVLVKSGNEDYRTGWRFLSASDVGAVDIDDLPLNLGATLTFVKDGIRATNGETYNSSTVYHTDYVDVSGFAAIVYTRLKTESSTSTYCSVAFYDENKTFVSAIRPIYNDVGGTALEHAEIPSGAVYARFCMFANNRTSFRLYDESQYSKALKLMGIAEAGSGGGGGTSDYDQLSNRPQINGNTLTGNKTAAQLGLAAASDIPTVPVQSVNGQTGAVVLGAADVGAKPSSYEAPVASVNGKTGSVVLAASDVGAGTYSKPSGGIPASDLASAVQTSLGKADTAYQKPSGGIPAADLASGVIPTVPTKVSDLTNDSGFVNASGAAAAAPVQSVNGQTGAVRLTAESVGAAPAVDELTISATGDVTRALDAGKIYHFTGTPTGLTLTLNAPSSGQIAQYHFNFDSGTTATAVTLVGVTWPGGSFIPEANKRYEVDILNGYGVWLAW